MKYKTQGLAPLMLIAGVSVLFVVGMAVAYARNQSAKQREDNQQKEAEQKIVSEKISGLEARLQQLNALQGSTTKSSSDDAQSSAIQKEIEKLKIQNTQLVADSRKRSPVVVISERSTVVQSSTSDVSNNSQISVAGLVEKVKHAVVAINTRKGSGSGFLISNNIVVTNAHVVGGIFSVGLHIDGAATTTGYVAGVDEKNDIAIITTSSVSVTPLSFGDSNELTLKQGDPVYAFGFPFGLVGDPSFATGILSRRLTQDGVPYLEISNELHFGNSGGPLVNKQGEVVGMFKEIFGMGTSDGTMLGESIKFAIPGNTVKMISGRLIAQAQPLSIPQKSGIDSYEAFMSRLEYVRAELSNLLSYREDVVRQKDLVALKQLSAYANTAAGEAVDLKKDIPVIPSKNTILGLVEIREKQGLLLRDIFDNEQAIIKGVWGNNNVTQLEIKRSQMDKQMNDLDDQYTEQEKTLDAAMRGFSFF